MHVETRAMEADTLDDDDYDWSAAVEEIDRIHQGEAPIYTTGPWGSHHGVDGPQHARVPLNAVQKPLTSFFESTSQHRSHESLLPAEGKEQAEQGGVHIDPEAATTWIYPGNVSRREYQYHIVSRALYENVMVVLPTGLGKTFIAAVLMYNYFRWFPEGKVVFLAPSKPLVNQQVEACYGIMGIPQECTSELTGAVEPKVRKGLWQEKRVFFLTPQTLEMDLNSGTCPRESVVLIVFDEAHRATGNHSYCNIIREMQKVNARYRILALTATPGSDYQAIQNVIDNLCISRLEHRGEEHAEVAMYTHSKEKLLIKVALDQTSLSVRSGFHSVVQPILGRLCSFGAYYNKNVDSVTPWQLLEAKTRFAANPPAHVPQGNFSEISRLFNVAHSLATALTLLSNDGLPQCYKYLEGKLNDNGPLKWHRDVAFDDLMAAMKQLVRKGAPTPKLIKLEEILAAHFERLDPTKTRVIIFSERRESVKDINEMLKKLAPKVRSTEFKGQASGKNNNKGQSQKRQQAVLKEFREGAFNVIVSTSIGEEGLDVGEVDLVVCFDAAASPLRMVQRMGRTGRKRQGRVVILAAEGKEVRDYEKNQDKMRRIQRKMQNGGQDFNKHDSPRMVPHVFKPQMRTIIMDIPDFIHRGNVTVRTPLLVDPGTEDLSAEEAAALARWPSTRHSWLPSLIAFSNFQSQPSKVHRVRHAVRSMELFMGVLQRLHCDPPETMQPLPAGDASHDVSNMGLAVKRPPRREEVMKDSPLRDEEQRSKQRLVESQQESERPAASQYDLDMVVPDSGSEGEDDTCGLTRACSQRLDGRPGGAANGSFTQQRASDREANNDTEKKTFEPQEWTGTKQAPSVSEMHSSPLCGESESECRVPETPCSQPGELPAGSGETEGEDRVPETPGLQDGTAGAPAGCHVATCEAPENRDAVEETPDMEAVLMQEADALFEADVLQKEDDVTLLRELKPVPFPGFSPMPCCTASPYSLEGVVPETPESMALQRNDMDQQLKLPLQQNGDQGSWAYAIRSPFWKPQPKSLLNRGDNYHYRPAFQARAHIGTGPFLSSPTLQVGRCTPVGPLDAQIGPSMPFADGFPSVQRQIGSAHTQIACCAGPDPIPRLQAAIVSGPQVQASAQPSTFPNEEPSSSHVPKGHLSAFGVPDPSPTQWERLNASLREQRASSEPENAKAIGQEEPLRPAHSICRDGLVMTTNPGLSLTSSHAASPSGAAPRPDLALSPPNLGPPRIKTPGSELSDWEPRPIRRGHVDESSQRSSGKWRAPAGTPSAEPPRKLRRLRKRNSGTVPTGMDSVPTETKGDLRRRKQAMQQLVEGDQKRARKLASVFFDEEAEVSGSDGASDDDEEGSAEADDSFIDDRSQPKPSAGGATPSTGTEASPADMMALYRRSLLSQSPLKATSPLEAPRFKSPPRPHANKNYGKMRFLPGRRDSTDSEEASSRASKESLALGEQLSLASGEQTEEEANVVPGYPPADKDRKLALADGPRAERWTSWQMPATDNGKEKEEGYGNNGWNGKKRTLNPSFKAVAPQNVFSNRHVAAANQRIEHGQPDPLDARHGAAGASALSKCETADDNFLEGLDLAQLEAEAFAARSQHAPRTVFSGHPSTVVGAVAVVRPPASISAHNPSIANGCASQEVPRRQEGNLSQAPILRNRILLACDRLSKRTSLVEVDSMPSFDLGLD